MPRRAAHLAIRAYQLTLSAALGRHCRYLPTCSHYADEAIDRHGLWAGGWMGLARLCRCHPLGNSGFDPVPDEVPSPARWYAPWHYGTWRLGKGSPADDGAVNEPLRGRSGVPD